MRGMFRVWLKKEEVIWKKNANGSEVNWKYAEVIWVSIGKAENLSPIKNKMVCYKEVVVDKSDCKR